MSVHHHNAIDFSFIDMPIVDWHSLSYFSTLSESSNDHSFVKIDDVSLAIQHRSNPILVPSSSYFRRQSNNAQLIVENSVDELFTLKWMMQKFQLAQDGI
jgi:hypothetical protein